MDSVSLYVLVEVTLQTNVDSQVGSMRCPAVQKSIPFEPEKHSRKTVSVKSGISIVSDVIAVLRF